MIMSVSACNPDSGGPSASGKTSAQRAQEWIEKQIADDTLFSFEYDGKSFAEFISSWEKKTETGVDGTGNKTYTLTYVSPDGLTAWADVVFNETYSALEWCCYFKNGASADSKVISIIQAIDANYAVSDPVLTTAKGSDTTESEFEPVVCDLSQTPSHTFFSSGGRSSQGGFPYYDISNGRQGVLGAIGWTGQWSATVSHDNGTVNIKAGMMQTQISLYAGEDMRAPSMVLMFFDGDQDAGHNKFRQMILSDYTPADKTGAPVTVLPLCMNRWGAVGEKSLLDTIEQCDRLELDYDLVWVDAGWYGDAVSADTHDTTWVYQNGNMYVNKAIYPNGFMPVAEVLDAKGKDLLLWFEPERAFPGTQMVNDYPQYFLHKSDTAQFHLYDLGSDEACDFLINLIDGLIKENGIDWYRQDFNVEPYNTWLSADNRAGENRLGMTEIKYITNLYRYIDTLLERNPGLMMDNCASGGKRLDIEMMKRSVPLWRTDFNLLSSSTADHVRSINYNLTWWLPLHGGAAGSDGRNTNYTWRSMQASALVVSPSSRDMTWFREMTGQYQQCRELMNGDYYIITQGVGTTLTTENAMYEFYKPDMGEGYLMVFRPIGCTVAEQTYRLKGLDAESTYVLDFVDTGDTFEATGSDLMEKGLALNISDPGNCLLIFINKK